MSWVYNARRFNHDFTKRFQTLVTKFNAKVTDDNSEQTGQELQSTMEGLNAKTYVLFYDNDLAYIYGGVDTTVLSTVQTLLPEEPDGVNLRAYIEFDSVGGYVPDRSGFEHHARTFGIARMKKGIEYGRGTISIETVFDGRSTYAEVPDHPDFAIDDVSSFSLQFRFLPFSISKTEGGSRPVVISKIDAYNAETWYSFELDPDGRAIFTLVVGGTNIYRIATPTGTIAPVSYGDITSSTERYDVVITWDNSTSSQILKLYINNTAYTTVINTLDPVTKVPDYLGTNLQIGRFTDIVSNIVDSAFVVVSSGYDSSSWYDTPDNAVFIGPETLVSSTVITSGNKYPPRFKAKLYFGLFQQLKYWRNKVLTATEVSHHYTNKLSITDIPHLNVAIPEGVILLSST